MMTKISKEQMVEWLKKSILICDVWPKILADSPIIEWAKESKEMMRTILAALEEKSPKERLIQAVKDYLEWGPMTNSDRDLHESRFREALAALEERTEELSEEEKGGVSEEETKEALELFDDLIELSGIEIWDEKKKQPRDLIRDLILGSRGGAVTEEFVEKWVDLLLEDWDRADSRMSLRGVLKEMLRDAGIEIGVAVTEKK